MADLRAPYPTTSRTTGSPTNRRITSSGSPVDTTMTSTSPMVSRKRRRLPMGSTSVTPGTVRSAATTSVATRVASRIGVRRSLPRPPRRSRAVRMFSSVFGPRPGRPRSAWASRAVRRSATPWIPSSSRSITAVLGPMPGIRVSSTNSVGKRARSSSNFAIRPVSTSSRIRRAVLAPTPRRLSSSFSVISAAARSRVSTVRAAASYARTRKALLLPSSRVASRASSSR